MPDNYLMRQSTEDGRSLAVLQEFLERVRDRLMPEHGYMESLQLTTSSVQACLQDCGNLLR